MTEQQIEAVAREFHDHAHAANEDGYHLKWDQCPPWQRGWWRRVAQRHLQQLQAREQEAREAAADYCLEWAIRGSSHPESTEGTPGWQEPPNTDHEPYTRGWVDAMRHASSKIRDGKRGEVGSD